MSAILGRPVTIIEFLQNNNLEVHEDALCPILFNERVIFRKVVVVSIAGLFRKGKSFLMNYFLRYLYAHVS